MNPRFFDDDIPPDASRTFGPTPHRRDFTALKTIVAIALIALGCALLITAGSPPTAGL